jgi:predicted chitinase
MKVSDYHPDIFFKVVRETLFDGRLTQCQADGINYLIRAWSERGQGDTRRICYLLATVYLETGHTMQAIEEWGRGHGKKYGVPDPETGKVYYGRGFVQLTWKTNYDKLGKFVGHDLVRNPEDALQPDLAALIAFEGSWRGLFTGHKMADYFNEGIEDPINARRIINGLDRAHDIADYYRKFLAAAEKARR